MPIASVDITLLDGALGVASSGTPGHTGFVFGPATSGDLLVPAQYTSPEDVEAIFVAGPLVDHACTILRRTAKPLIVMRSNSNTDGAYDAINLTGVTGGCVPSADSSVKPYGEYEAYFEVVTGGTVGVAGITYKTSLDDGRTLSTLKSLGTATSITIAEGNVKWHLTSATLNAGDIVRQRTEAPFEGNTEFADALTAIGESSLNWDVAYAASKMSGTQAGAVDTWLEALWAKQIHKAARLNARSPAVGESEAAYLASLTADFAGTTSKRMTVSAGYCEMQSGASGARRYRRSAGLITACRALGKTFVPWKNDLGQVDLGNVGGDVRIRDAKGNRKSGLHDEFIDPGLDAAQFETLTSLPGFTGAYVTTPRAMASVGSDYYLWQYAAVTNRAADAVTQALMLRCRKPIRANPKTGYIRDAEARDIDKYVASYVRNAVGDAVSGFTFAIGRYDNLLAANAKATAKLRMVPLAYPVGFAVEMGFENPATGVA